jgi:PEP-CTERM motif
MKRALFAITCGLVLLPSATALAVESISTNEASIFQTLSQAAAAVSEPATLSLLGVALLGAAWIARKRRQKVSPQA